jgi:isopropylmalate/homocitrate/citramalate synthase
MEIGFKNIKKPDSLQKYGDSFFCSEEYINSTVGDLVDIENGCSIAVMVTINAFDFNDFVPRSQSKISLVRVLMAYHGSKDKTDDEIDLKELVDGVAQCEKFIDLGYEVSFNIGRIDKMSFDLIEQLCEIIANTRIHYFIMADTYGCIDLHDIEILLPYVKSLFQTKFNNQSIQLGFHAHDNMSNGTSKALHSLKFGIDMIDGCCLGYGRASGNAKTELLLMDLNKNYNKNYNLLPLLDFAENYITSYKDCLSNLSYNVVYALSSYFGCHVTYALTIIEKYDKIDIGVIYKVFEALKNKKKNMFFNDKLLHSTINEVKESFGVR